MAQDQGGAENYEIAGDLSGEQAGQREEAGGVHGAGNEGQQDRQ